VLWSWIKVDTDCLGSEEDIVKKIEKAVTVMNYFRIEPMFKFFDKFSGETDGILGPAVFLDKEYRIISLNCDTGITFTKIL
jgi:hypothetical protein